MNWKHALLPFVLLPLMGAVAEPSQKELAEQLGALANKCSVEVDAKGDVVRFAASNHDMYRKDESKPGNVGITDEDAKVLRRFPHLQAVYLEGQPLSDAGYAVLADLPELVDVRLHSARGKQNADHPIAVLATSEFPLVINRLAKPLKILEIKHHFSIKGECMAALKPQPELEKLELDNDYSGPAAVDFIRAAARVKNLQLHRTKMGDADLVRALEPLKGLEVLEVRPVPGNKDPITGRSFRVLRDHAALRAVYLSLDWPDLQWADGVEHLATIKTLKLVDVAGTRPEMNRESAAITKLHELRPDITIILGKDRIEGVPATVNPGKEDVYHWGITS